MEDELWRQCVRWLIEVGVLPRQHKTTCKQAHIFDLAQTLRDGVVLCNLLNVIKPGAVSLSCINIRPQMLQFLCLENLRAVIQSLQDVFGFNKQDLFNPHELYNLTNFRQVLKVLSSLSQSPISVSRFRPFPDTIQHHVPQRSEDEEIYKNLPDLASERELADEDNLYDTVPTEEKEESIYGTIVNAKRSSTLKDKRSHCVNEILETEKNYLKHLYVVKHQFIDPLRKVLTDKDIRSVFSNLEQLIPVHEDFLTSFESATNNKMSKLSAPFLKAKDRFLKYGLYCSTLQDSVAYLNELMKTESIRTLVEDLQDNAGPNKFKLRELLYVSMQRIMKYHLLVKELNKHTKDSHSDKADLAKALEGMQELSHYVNEVKRDTEMLQTISKVESRLIDYTVDGELKVKISSDSKAKQRFTYLFDQAIFMTSMKHDMYKLKDLVRLEDYIVEDIPQSRGGKQWSWSWSLRDKRGSHVYILSAKTNTEKEKWMEGTKSAFEIVNPAAMKGKSHAFKMKTFKEPTYCSACKKLLLGSFFQGYYCERSNKACHSWCLSDTWKSISESLLENGSVSSDKISQNGGMFRSHREYNGRPRPPFDGAGVITFGMGEQVQVDDQVSSEWWLGRTVSMFNRAGYFPASYVSPIVPHSSASRASRSNLESSSSVYDVAKPMPSTPIQLELYYWYAGALSREEATACLTGKPSGTYLVRTRGDNLAISLMFQNDVKHIRIHHTQNMFHVAECKNFKSVQELVKFYQENLMNSSFLGLDTTLMYPYRDPKFFPNTLPLKNTQRRSFPNSPLVTRPPLHRHQTFSHPQASEVGRPSSSDYPGTHRPNFKVLGQGRVLYDFEPRTTQELGLKAHQLVNIINKAGDEHGWWKGESNGRVGYFPSSFIQEIHSGFSKMSLR